MEKIAIFIMGRKRPGFDMAWGETITKQVKELLTTMKYEAIYPQIIVDAKTMQESVQEAKSKGAKIGVVLQPTMGDGRLAPLMSQHWGSALIFWATPEKGEGKMISSCSLVGTHVFAATLSQLNIKSVFMYASPTANNCQQDLDDAISLARACYALPQSCLGLIGHHAPGFIDMHPNLGEMSKTFGVQMKQFAIHDFMALMQTIPENEIEQDFKLVQEMSLPSQDITDSDLKYQSKNYLAIKQLMEDELLEGVCLREWPEFSGIDGMWAYLSLSRLGNENIPISCEGDVDGALVHLIAKYLDLGSVFLSDWLEHTQNTITLWHGGFIPFDLCKPLHSKGGPTLTKHFNGKNPTVIDSELEEDMDVTLFRIWCHNGRYKITALEGKTIPLTREFYGNHGLVHVEEQANLTHWLEDKIYSGMPHHVSVVRGHRRRLLQRFAQIFQLEWEA